MQDIRKNDKNRFLFLCSIISLTYKNKNDLILLTTIIFFEILRD